MLERAEREEEVEEGEIVIEGGGRIQKVKERVNCPKLKCHCNRSS